MKATNQQSATKKDNVKKDSADVAAKGLSTKTNQKNQDTPTTAASAPIVNQFNSSKVSKPVELECKAPKIEVPADGVHADGTIWSNGELICRPGSHAGMTGY
jgi:hypothetical protein